MSKGKVLVTGGTGYIGSHTVVELINNDYEVEILDNLFNSKIEVLDKIQEITGIKPAFHKVDLLDFEATRKVFENNNFDFVLHFAGLKAVAESIQKPLRYYENNIGGTLNLLKCMNEFNVKKLVFSSSATVYGTQDETEFIETMTTGRGITNPYGETKFMIEEILKDTSRANPDFSVTILRYFNPIGAHKSGLLGEDPNDIPNNLMPIVMKVAAGEISELAVFGDDYPTHDGTCIRDFIHVVDLAKGHLAAMAKMNLGVQIYNLGSGKGTSVLEIISAFENASGKKLPYKIVGRRDGDLAEMHANASLAYEKLGWKTELSAEDAMRDTIYYLERFTER